jgi:hypothetical protein
MFGTIGRARPKPGKQVDFWELQEFWQETVRPQVPGSFLELVGRSHNRPDEIVFIALAQDEPTYRQLAELPAQGEFYRRLVELLEEEPTWEDVALDIVVQD